MGEGTAAMGTQDALQIALLWRHLKGVPFESMAKVDGDIFAWGPAILCFAYAKDPSGH